MDATLAPQQRRIRVRDIELAVREWPGAGRPFLLVHGLASNARTWDIVARYLNEAGHAVVAVDQRGHGLSDKPEQGYGFNEVTADLRALIEALGWQRPVLGGQSWGGNIVLDFAARWPERLSGLVLVDGGFIELAATPGATWEQIADDLKPPSFVDTPRDELVAMRRAYYKDWNEEAIEMALGNFETLPDGTVRSWLRLDHHLEILRALWEQRPSALYEQIKTPTLIAAADEPWEGRDGRREAEVALAEAKIARVAVKWFQDTYHDIHLHRPRQLVDWIEASLRAGFFDE